jgi:hypothetical protein
MKLSIETITNPISLCAYVLFLVSSLLAKKWKVESDKPYHRQLFHFFASLAVVTLAVGLVLAWRQQSNAAYQTPASSVTQSSSGNQSPNINSSGSGPVTVQIGPAQPPSAAPADGKK